MIMGISFSWDEGFPKGYAHTSIGFLKRCPGFWEAKQGDIDAALYVVDTCVKQNRINLLRERYCNAILIPVLGRNQLPLALAWAIGLEIWYGVYLMDDNLRKSFNAMQRLLHKPVFAGRIHKDKDYILVDDVVVQGGTVAALREYIIVNGGRVVAVVALAYSIGSYDIAPLEAYLLKLKVNFGQSLILLLQIHRIAFSFHELTNSQVKYLLRFTSIENVERKIKKVS
jgi:hypothetical protein